MVVAAPHKGGWLTVVGSEDSMGVMMGGIHGQDSAAAEVLEGGNAMGDLPSVFSASTSKGNVGVPSWLQSPDSARATDCQQRHPTTTRTTIKDHSGSHVKDIKGQWQWWLPTTMKASHKSRQWAGANNGETFCLKNQLGITQGDAIFFPISWINIGGCSHKCHSYIWEICPSYHKTWMTGASTREVLLKIDPHPGNLNWLLDCFLTAFSL